MLESIIGSITAVGIIAIAAGILRLRDYCSRRDAPRRYWRYLKARFRQKNFTLFTHPPFVVVSDEGEEDVKNRLDQAVPWLIENLAAIGLTRRPRPGMAICVFKEWRNYQDCSELLMGGKRLWTGGNFFRQLNAIIADISDGNSGLLHEMVHAFVYVNLPNCPDWLNEGLACLFAGRSQDRDGVGWQRERVFAQMLTAVRENRVLPLERLCAMSNKAFHIDDEVRNYSEATCLCYRLHDRALLGEYCRRFRKNRRRDPTGYKTLTALLGCADMQECQWEAFLNMVDIQNLQHRP
jgi:hypothetical protein